MFRERCALDKNFLRSPRGSIRLGCREPKEGLHALKEIDGISGIADTPRGKWRRRSS